MEIYSFYAHKKVLVTGGCGFIGSHLAEKLVATGAQVTILDNLSTGSLENIQTFKEKVTFVQKNITNYATCSQIVQGNEIIFHLAAFISVPGSVKNPLSCHKANVNGTLNLLDAAKKHGIRRFVFSSTSAVYGPRNDVCRESDTHLTPVSPYGATKLMGEMYCNQYALLYGIPCVSLRYFNVYGPRQNPHAEYAAVVAKFQHQFTHNKPVTIFGDGTQTRDFIPVDQVVEANLLVGMAPTELINGHSFNIGSGTSISIHHLAQKMKKEFPHYSNTIQFAPAREGDVSHTQMSNQKFNQLKVKLLP